MHSLTQLNVYSNVSIVTGDERPTSFTTTPANVSNLTSTVYSTEDTSHNLVVPFTIDSAISLDVVYTVNVSMYSGATVTWPTQDLSLTYTNPSTGIYRVSGIGTITQWNAQKNPLVYMGPDRNGNLTYNANIHVGNTTISWNNYAILAGTAEINTGILADQYYDEDIPITFNSGLLITDSISSSYSVAISKSNNAGGVLSSTGVGGTSTYSANVLTIAGNKTQVNSQLGNITLTPGEGFANDFALTYNVLNVTSGEPNSAQQSMKIRFISDEINTNTLTNQIYNQDDPITFNSGLIITNVSTVATYSLTISKPSNATGVLSSTGVGGTSSYANNTLTITGNKSQINTRLTAITFTPTTGPYTDFTLTYTLTNLLSNQVDIATQSMTLDYLNNNVSTMSMLSTYIQNIKNTLFATNIPTITEDIRRPTAPFVVDAYTALLLHFDGNLTDSSNNAYTPGPITPNGITYESVYRQWGTGCAKFTTTPLNQSILEFKTDALKNNSSAFTAECWVNPGADNTGGQIFKLGPYIVYAALLALNQLKIYLPGGTNVYLGPIIESNKFTHIAVTYNNGNWYVHVNGILKYTVYQLITGIEPTWSGMFIGSNLNANIDEFRYSKGIARYSNSNFTVASYTLPQYTINLQLSTDIGFISTNTDHGYFNKLNYNSTTRTYTFTGYRDQCNSIFADLQFYPTLNTTSGAIITYSHIKNGVFQFNRTFNLTGVANTNSIPGSGVISYTTPGTYTFVPTAEQYLYLDCDAFLVGGGGDSYGMSGIQNQTYTYYTNQAYDLLYSVRNGTVAQKTAAEATLTTSSSIQSTYPMYPGGGGGADYDIFSNVSISSSMTLVVPDLNQFAYFGDLYVGKGMIGLDGASAQGGRGGQSGNGDLGVDGTVISFGTRPLFNYQTAAGGFLLVRGIVVTPPYGGKGGGGPVTVTFAGTTYSNICEGAPGNNVNYIGTYGCGNSPGLVVLNFKPRI